MNNEERFLRLADVLATPRGRNLNEAVDWAVDEAGILVQRRVEA